MTEKETQTGTAGTPRWVKVFGSVAVVVVVLVAVVLFAGRGGHGPGRHAPAGEEPGGHSGPRAGMSHRQP